MASRLLKLSVNPTLIDKTIPGSHGFESSEFSIEDLAEAVQLGCAFSYQFLGDIRRSVNFKATDILAIDIDAGMTLDEAMGNDIVKRYASLIYTTASHSPDRHRFRLVFALPRTITDGKELRAATRSLARRLGGDMSAIDPARVFYGSTNCKYEICGSEISTEFLTDLIADGKAVLVSDLAAHNDLTSATRSKQKVERDLVLTASNGAMSKISSFQSKETVYCPFHQDKTASAFVAINDKGSTYLYCSTCGLTRWMENKQDQLPDFNEFVNTLRELKNNPPKKIESELISLEKFIASPISRQSDNVKFSYDKFFKLDDIQPGLSFIRSPKGSGKTTYLGKALQKDIYTAGDTTLESFENNSEPDGSTPFFTNKRVLLIGHRQALIRDLCKRLGLNCYLDDPNNRGDVIENMRRYGVCLDSLIKVCDQTYDVIIIDEVEQVLAHFLSDTIGSARYPIFEEFTRLIQNAKSVVALDADLGWTSFNTITALKSEFLNGKNGAVPVHIYINDFKNSSKCINVYSSHDQMVQKLKDEIIDGKRVFVTSNSKSKINSLSKAIEAISVGLDKPLQTFTITSENSKSKEAQFFIKNIKNEILNYDVVLSSPSLGTGVDITFENGASEIDSVFGFFVNRINSHTDIDQQLVRVRNPKEVNVWVSSDEYNFETEFDVVKEDYLKHDLMAKIYSGADRYAQRGRPTGIDPFLYMAVMITAYQRASKNKLRKNFLTFKVEQGWVINEIPLDQSMAIEGKDFFKGGEALSVKERTDALLIAEPMSRYEYSNFRDRQDSNEEQVSQEEKYSYYRTSIELFHQSAITKNLIELDDQSRFRQKVNAFCIITSREKICDINKFKKMRHQGLKSQRVRESTIKNQDSAHLLLHELLSTIPFFNGDVFDSTTIFSDTDLIEFADLASKMKSFVENHLGLNIRSDVLKNPVQQLGPVLEKIGLSYKKIATKSVSKKKKYYYQLSKDDVEQMLFYCNLRSGITGLGWDFVDQLHGFSVHADELVH
jgi:hypothetical protein